MTTLGGRVQAVSVGKIRALEVRGRASRSGIDKTPVSGPVRAEGTALEGDEQAERKIHGGSNKAVYAFATEHYPSWQASFPSVEIGWGRFGENLSLEGIRETDVAIGDRFRCGSTELVVTEPRLPCAKLIAWMGDPKVFPHMLETGQTGFYLSIAKEGVLQAGDAFERVFHFEDGLSIAELVRLKASPRPDPESIRRALRAPALTDFWRTWLEARTEG